MSEDRAEPLWLVGHSAGVELGCSLCDPGGETIAWYDGYGADNPYADEGVPTAHTIMDVVRMGQDHLRTIHAIGGDANDRMQAALGNPEHLFTRDQVGYLISMILGTGDGEDLAWRAGYEAGYWARVAEENAAYPPARTNVCTSAGEDAIRVHRARMGVDKVGPREGDFPGIGMDAVEKIRQEGVE